jgi:hypothetical protein
MKGRVGVGCGLSVRTHARLAARLGAASATRTASVRIRSKEQQIKAQAVRHMSMFDAVGWIRQSWWPGYSDPQLGTSDRLSNEGCGIWIMEVCRRWTASRQPLWGRSCATAAGQGQPCRYIIIPMYMSYLQIWLVPYNVPPYGAGP